MKTRRLLQQHILRVRFPKQQSGHIEHFMLKLQDVAVTLDNN